MNLRQKNPLRRPPVFQNGTNGSQLYRPVFTNGANGYSLPYRGFLRRALYRSSHCYNFLIRNWIKLILVTVRELR